MNIKIILFLIKSILIKNGVIFMLSESSKFLEHAFDMLNDIYFNSELPNVVITIQSSPRTNGHITTQKIWSGVDNCYYEINISAEHLNRPCEQVLATLVHEMVHLYCMERGIADTSKNGRYHNKRFKAECEKRDLHIEYAQYIGYSVTVPTENFIKILKMNNLICDLGFVRSTGETLPPTSGGNSRPKSSTRKYICPSCGISVRATKEVEIICKLCMCDMMKECK